MREGRDSARTCKDSSLVEVFELKIKNIILNIWIYSKPQNNLPNI